MLWSRQNRRPYARMMYIQVMLLGKDVLCILCYPCSLWLMYGTKHNAVEDIRVEILCFNMSCSSKQADRQKKIPVTKHRTVYTRVSPVPEERDSQGILLNCQTPTPSYWYSCITQCMANTKWLKCWNTTLRYCRPETCLSNKHVATINFDIIMFPFHNSIGISKVLDPTIALEWRIRI